jgi:diguanylate cyclase (GGDEF)-like protein
MLPNTAEAQACHIAQRLRSDIRIAMLEAERYGPPVTVSIGVAEMEAADNQWEDVVDAADRALYQAKSEGRDRVVLCERKTICANKIPK